MSRRFSIHELTYRLHGSMQTSFAYSRIQNKFCSLYKFGVGSFRKWRQVAWPKGTVSRISVVLQTLRQQKMSHDILHSNRKGANVFGGFELKTHVRKTYLHRHRAQTTWILNTYDSFITRWMEPPLQGSTNLESLWVGPLCGEDEECLSCLQRWQPRDPQFGACLIRTRHPETDSGL